MNYLHSPSRHHRLSSKSPMSLFDSPSLSSHRYSDPYQALSCESPPPNFDHLQTPLQPPRRTLDWGSDVPEKRTPLAATTPTNTHMADFKKTTPQRPSLKSPVSYATRTTPTRPTTKPSPAAAGYKSPMERTRWSEISSSVSPVRKLETTPIRYHMEPIPSSLSSTRQRQQQLENTSPMNTNPMNNNHTSPINNKNNHTSVSSPLKLTTSAEILYKQSPLDSGRRQDTDDSYRSSNKRPLEYIRSPVRNVTDNANNYIYDNTISPLRSSNKKTPTPTKSTPMTGMTQRPLDAQPFDRSPKTEPAYHRRLSFDAVSPLVDTLYHGKVDDGGVEDLPQPVTVTTYRSPVYSNSSYKPSDKQSKTPISQPSPIATASTGTHYVRPVSPPSPILPVRPQQGQPASLYTQQKQQSTGDEGIISRPLQYEPEQHVQRYSPITNQSTEDNNSSPYRSVAITTTLSPEKRTSSVTTTTATETTASATTKMRQPQRQPVDLHHHRSQDRQQSRPTINVTPKSPVSHQRSYRADLPHYMRTTESYQSRLQAQADNYQYTKLLHKTKSGGVMKKTQSPRIQPFRSTTKINALDDIKNEMTPEEVYVSLAERVKQFEKGLGNGRSTTSATHHQHSSNADIHGVTKAKSPHLLTRERSANSSYHRHELDEPQQSTSSSTAHHRLLQETQHQDRPRHLDALSNRPHLKRQRSTSTTIKDDDNNRRPIIPKSKKKKHQHHYAQGKPFHFETDDRAARYQQTFRAKLDLWKEKDSKDKRQ